MSGGRYEFTGKGYEFGEAPLGELASRPPQRSDRFVRAVQEAAGVLLDAGYEFEARAVVRVLLPPAQPAGACQKRTENGTELPQPGESVEVDSPRDRYAMEHPSGNWHVAPQPGDVETAEAISVLRRVVQMPFGMQPRMDGLAAVRVVEERVAALGRALEERDEAWNPDEELAQARKDLEYTNAALAWALDALTQIKTYRGGPYAKEPPERVMRRIAKEMLVALAASVSGGERGHLPDCDGVWPCSCITRVQGVEPTQAMLDTPDA